MDQPSLIQRVPQRLHPYSPDPSITIVSDEEMQRKRYQPRKERSLMHRFQDAVQEQFIAWEPHRWTPQGKRLLLGLLLSLLCLLVYPWIRPKFDPEPYGSSKCTWTLIKGTTFTEGGVLPQPTPLPGPLRDALLATQECYLTHYPDYQCISPLSYGHPHHVISFRDPHPPTQITHWIHPKILDQGPATVVTMEKDSFWPDKPAQQHQRPEWIFIEALTPEGTLHKTTLRGAAAVCIAHMAKYYNTGDSSPYL